jgi:hypothetical protein
MVGQGDEGEASKMSKPNAAPTARGEGLFRVVGSDIEPVCFDLRIDTPGTYHVQGWTFTQWARLPQSQRHPDAQLIPRFGWALWTLIRPLSSSSDPHTDDSHCSSP